MKEAIMRRPWLWIIGIYMFAMLSWIFMVSVAIRHQQADVPLVLH